MVKKSFKLDGDLLETIKIMISMLPILIHKMKNYFMNLEKKRNLILGRKDEKLTEINLL